MVQGKRGRGVLSSASFVQLMEVQVYHALQKLMGKQSHIVKGRGISLMVQGERGNVKDLDTAYFPGFVPNRCEPSFKTK